MQRGKTLARTVTGLLLTGALLGIAVPASAAAPGPSATAGTAPTKTVFRTVKVGTAAAADYSKNCFGYTGNFKTGSSIMYADWNYDGTIDECFGIAPNRTIWHAWPNSGAWRVMPHGGLADDTVAWYVYSDGDRGVVVKVNNIGDYCSDYTTAWQSWYPCDL